MLAKKKRNTDWGTIEFDLDDASVTAAKFIMATLAVSSIVLSGSIAPGLLALNNNRKSKRRYTENQLRNAYYNLKRNKLVEIMNETDGKIQVKLTNKGRKRIKEFSFETLTIRKPTHWDKKWRILIFDIPTKPKIYNAAREALRNKIKELGFYQLQKSVWVYPYECEDEILLIAELYHVQKHIEIITAENLLHEETIKKHFSLA